MPPMAGTDGQIVPNLPVPMNYTLTVEANSTVDRQTATDEVGPIILFGGSGACMYCMATIVYTSMYTGHVV